MEKQYMNGKEIVSKCSWCEQEGRTTYLNGGKPITDYNDIWDIEDKLILGIAILSHGMCLDCLERIYPEMANDDSLQLLDNPKNK